jgi:class 3 adenylate cyclase
LADGCKALGGPFNHEGKPMAFSEGPASAAVQVAWRIAAGVARACGGDIEITHFLYGIFSLDKIQGLELPPEVLAEVEQEVRDLQHRCSIFSIDFQSVRRGLRGAISQGKLEAPQIPSEGTLRRSTSVRQAFQNASRLRNEHAPLKVGLIRLTRALLEQEPSAAAYLLLSPARYPSFLLALNDTDADVSNSPRAAEGISIIQSLNAETTIDAGVDWARVGPRLAEFTETCWNFREDTKIEGLYEAALKLLLAGIKGAERAAMMIEDASGNLLLKAHLPKGVLPASSSSARKAMQQRESLIWQRGEDPSASQLESELQAGIYAPVLSHGHTFGVICLDAKATGLRFTQNDLFLATAVGRQLGLAVRNRRLEEDSRQSARIMERLMTNFSPKVRERLLLKAQAGRLRLGGEKSTISILCADIRGFSLMSAGMDTEDVVSLLNDYFSAMVAVIFRHGGSIDKFMGDAILAVFGSPEPDPLHTEACVVAALEMQSEVKRISTQRQAAGLRACEIGIGVHIGEVIHGFIGSPDRMEFTVIGSTVNLASRYCAAAGAGEVILSAEMVERVWKKAVVESVDISTKHEGELAAFRLLNLRSDKR